jgi:histidinol-phosphate aminotransferase
MTNPLSRRDALRLGGILSGSALLSSWKTIQTWDNQLLQDTKKADENVARLCFNENPNGPSNYVKKYIAERISGSYVYPFAQINDLAEKLALKHGVTKDHIVITAGSTEGLRASALTFANNGKEIISCMPTFKAILDYAVDQGGELRIVPLEKDLNFDLTMIENSINFNTGLVYICNPNNPTSRLLNGLELRDFCAKASSKTVIFVDEAYYDYIKDDQYPSMISLVKEDKDVVVSRTFSKIYGLAGLRVGYIIARPGLAKIIEKNIQANTNIIGAWSAMAAMDDTSFYSESLRINTECLDIIYDACDKNGLNYLNSNTNFVFFKTGLPASDFQQRMKEQNVLVGRPFPPFTEWCRVCTGKIEDVEKFAKALPKALKTR